MVAAPRKRVHISCLIGVVCLLTILGCNRGSGTPDPQYLKVTRRTSSVGAAKFAFWHREVKQNGWEDNQKILIWVDFNYGETTKGSGGKTRQRAFYPDGQRILWEIETAQDEKMKVGIDGAK